MQKAPIIFHAYLFISVIAFLTCNEAVFDPTQFDKPICRAFISDTLIINPELKDSLRYSTCDTIATGSELFFTGIALSFQFKISSQRWIFGDEKSDSAAITTHRYAAGGIYTAIFIIEDNVGQFLSDSVIVHVNTPPDSVVLLSPRDSAKNQAVNPELQWQGFDRDTADTSLLYCLLLTTPNSTDTIMKWQPVTRFPLGSVLEKGVCIQWQVTAKDRYGETVDSRVSTFFTMRDDGDIEGYAVRQKRAGTNINKGIIVIAMGSGAEKARTQTDTAGHFFLAKLSGKIDLIFKDSSFFRSETKQVTVINSMVNVVDTVELQDISPPVFIRSPDQTVKQGTSLKVRFQAFDTLYSVNKVFADFGNGLTETNLTDTTISYTIPGDFIYRFKAVDENGNIGFDSLRIHVNFPPSTPTLTSPESFGDALINQPVLFSWQCSDRDNQDTMRAAIQIANNPQFSGTVITTENISGTTYSGWNPGGVTGVYYWKISVSDFYDTIQSGIDSFRVSNQTGFVQGSVFRIGKNTDKQGNKGIAVSAIKNSVVQATTTTDDSGSYTFPALSGQVSLRFTDFGFAPENRPITIINGITNIVPVQTMRDTLPPVITLSPDTAVKRMSPVHLRFFAKDTFYQVDSLFLNTGTGFHLTRAQDTAISFAEPGEHAVIFKAVDPNGNISFDSIRVHINFPPLVPQLIYPATFGEILANALVPFRWDCKDIDSSYSKLRYDVFISRDRAVPPSSIAASAVTNAGTFSWNPGAATGIYYWKIAASDGFDTVCSPVDSFRVALQGGSVSGIALRKGLEVNPVANRGIRVTALRDGIIQTYTTTNDSGRYDFPALLGRTSLVFSDYGFAPESLAITIINGISNSVPGIILRDTLPPTITHTPDTTVRAGALVLLSFFARDTFYTVDSLLVDFGNGFKRVPRFDSIVSFTSPGDHLVRFKAFDPNGNIGRDSMTIHINHPPATPTLVRPINSAETGTNTYPTFTWNCSDQDNPSALRYDIFIGSEPSPAASDRKNAGNTETNYALWSSGTTQQKYFWKVSAFDGFDTTLSAVDSFVVVDYTIITGSCSGYAKLQGTKLRTGIRIQLKLTTGSSEYHQLTDSIGLFRINNVFPGAYILTATAPDGRIFEPVQHALEILARKNTPIDTLTLPDKSSPTLQFPTPQNGDTIRTLPTRTLLINGALSDSGSGIVPDLFRIFLNNDTVRTATLTNSTWQCSIPGIADGPYTLFVTATDSAGNLTELQRHFYINAKQLSARLSDDTVSINDTVRIAITVNNANPGLASFRIRYTTIPDTLWDLNIAQPDTILTPFFIPRDSLASGMVTVESTDQAGMKTLATMPYTVCLDRPEASILYSPDTLVSINDTITLSDQTVNRFGKYEKKWIVRDTVLADTSRSIKVICTVAGTIPCSLSVIDDDGLRAAAGIRIHVRSFPPVAVATANADTVWGGDTIKLTTAGSHDSNAGGVIREYAWRFGLGGSNWKVVTAGDTIIAAQPERGTQCAVLRVTDDDGEIGYDTVKVEIFLKFIYVDSACINSLSRGNSWDTAMTDLQKALFNAKAGTTIRIAKGTYYPTKNGDRNISFELKSGVTLVGCYPNGGGIRDTALYPTILSGDIDSNSNLNGNSYHVIIAKNVDSTAIIDGITIYLGNADGNAEQTFGGGMFSLYSSPKIMNCRITNCYAKSNGGAMYNESSEPFILNTVFIHDSAITSGGAIYNKNASPKLFGCTFTNNYTTENGGAMYNDFSELLIENTNFIGDSSTAWGGAIYNKSSSVHINNCKFTDNRTNTYGGAMYNESSTIELLNSIFQNNHVDTSLPQKAACGGALYNVNSLLKIDSCSFASNYCSKDGGALYNSNSELKMTNCSLSINQALSTGGGISADSAPATFINCIFSDNYSGSVMGVPSGGGIYIGGSPLITNCTFTQNTAIGGSAHNRYGSGGGASINGSPILTNCIFADNYSGRNGGGLYITGSPTITNCSFTKNTSHSGLGSSSKGGGLYIEESAIISKCTFLNNICEGSTSTGRGGGIYIHGFLLMNNSTFTKNTVSGIRSFGGALHMNGGSLINCTFTQNTANTGSSSGGAVFDSGSTSYKSTLLNCLFWGDSASSSPEYYNDSNLTPTLKNCIIQNGYTGPGTLDSIFTFDPQLDSLRDNGGPVPTCAIPANSPARNAGTSNIPAGIDISTDARGMPRSDGKPDIGAYEVQ